MVEVASSHDSLLEESRYEPLVPPPERTSSPPLIEMVLCLPGQLKNDGGTTSSNPLSSSSVMQTRDVKAERGPLLWSLISGEAGCGG
jgi:hypothetical protein